MEKQKIVYTGGTFDLFHPGHVNFLKNCKKIGDYVIVSLNTDEFIERYKKSKPIILLINFLFLSIDSNKVLYCDSVIMIFI